MRMRRKRSKYGTRTQQLKAQETGRQTVERIEASIRQSIAGNEGLKRPVSRKEMLESQREPVDRKC